MKRKNTTRNALFTSIISLLLCVSMLVGTTFAWFTDSVVSGNNVIAAGNLNIELYNDGNKVTSQTNLFDGVKWEPGVVDYENFTIKNEGNLALLYDFAMNWGDYNTLAGEYNLTQILKVAMVDKHVSGDRAAAIAAGEAAGWKSLSDWSFSGEMTTKGETKDFALIIYWEPSDADNNWNVQNGKTLDEGEYLYVNLGINLQATQKMHESDSFGPDYDGLASDWDGSTGKVPEADEDGVITITTGAEQAAFAAEVNRGNSYSVKTVKLGADIDLGNQPWTPIGQTGPTTFAGTFDGNGKTLYNLNIDNTANTSEHGAAGLFGWIEQHSGSNSIKNLTINGVTINSHRYSGAVAGWVNIPVTNCAVKNVTINCSYYNDDTDGTKVGALVGYADNKSALTGNTVENAVLNAYGDVGGLAGVAQTTVSVDGNTVKNVQINYASTVKSEPGALASTRVTPVYGANTTENVTFVKSVIVSTADELAAALKSTDKDIVITLANNIDVPITSLGQQTGGSGEYKLAGEATETITLDLNGKKLNITTTYWSNIGAKNDDAVFTIKNGTMTSSQATGTWNSYDLTFSNCNYVIENVVFEKAVAFANAGKSTTLKNVTIKEPHDYYALWITAAGQTVEIDGLTINSTGRGIKIDEEYVGTPAKVTLKVSNADINTVKKAAIMVKSSAGADITLSNVNIADTIDTVHAVWVDEDSANYVDQVNVTGGEKIYEGNVVSNATELAEAVAAGKTDLWLLNGEYTLPTLSGKEGITIIGAADGSTVIGGENASTGFGSNFGKNTTIQNVNFSGTTNGVCSSYAQGGTTTFDNCTFAGDSTYGFHIDQSNGATFIFNNCTFSGFNAFAGDLVKVVFNNCTFLNNGNYGHTNIWSVAEFNNCTFGDKTSVGPGKNSGAKIYFNGVEESYHHEFVGTAESLFAFADSVNNGGDAWKGQKVVLVDNIDLNNQAWTPIGQTGATQFQGTFDGNGYTIKNLNIDSSAQTGAHYSSGLFGWLNKAVVKNLTIENATVTGNHNVAVIAGYLESAGCTISECHVINAAVVAKHANDDACGDKVGVIVGHAGNAGVKVENCSATDCTVVAGRDAGQIAGAAKAANVVDCTATNVTVTAGGDCTGANIKNEVIGRVL